MTVPREVMDRGIEEHFRYELNDDIEGVLSTLTADVTHDIVGYPTGPTTGLEAARAFYETMYADLADGKVTTIRRLYGDDFLVDESRWEGIAVGRPFGLEGRGRPLSFRLLHVIRYAQDHRMRSEQVWFDFPAILAQLPQD